jgi:hypothetical protein
LCTSGNLFEGEERFAPFKMHKNEESEILWKAWKDAYDLKSSQVDVFEPNQFLEECLKKCKCG